MMHIDYSALDNCVNLEDSYGEICVNCNCCGRFDPETANICKLKTAKRHLRETMERGPLDEEYRERNRQSTIRSYQKQIEKAEAAIASETK
jgi:hypothetical protein